LIIDGEIQPHIALDDELLKQVYPFSILAEKECNTIIFPGISSGNISFNLLQQVGKCDTIGPILLGMNKPVHILQLGSSVSEIVNVVAIAVVDAQQNG
jgi:malate dehydrogenase (oxaloacetate-decarboxylating)(NADP+)